MNRVVLGDASMQAELASIEVARTRELALCQRTPTIGAKQALEIAAEAWERDRQRRVVVGIGGFPASGKTTLARGIVNALNARYGTSCAVHLPMDGFHQTNAWLEAKHLANVKGDLRTYDVRGFIDKLQEYGRAPYGVLSAPDYLREEHEVREDAVTIAATVRILVTEGIYVGYAAGPWRDARDSLSTLLYLDVEPSVCADRIVARNLAVGRDERLIRQKLHNDFGFMEKSVTIMSSADYIVA